MVESSFHDLQDAVAIEKSDGPIEEMDAGVLLYPRVPKNKEQTPLPQKDDGLLLLEIRTVNRSMTENLFVNTRRLYAIEGQELRCYATGQKPDGSRYRLKQESLNKVAEKVSRCTDFTQAPEWIETLNLRETFVQRHIEGTALLAQINPS